MILRLEAALQNFELSQKNVYKEIFVISEVSVTPFVLPQTSTPSGFFILSPTKPRRSAGTG